TTARVLMPAFLRRSATNAPSALTIGIVEDPITEAASAAVAGSVRAAGEALAAASVRVRRLTSPGSVAGIPSWHKTLIEYESAHAEPHLEQTTDVSAAVREAVARGRLITDAAYLDAHAALGAARERFWLAADEADALLFPAAPDVAPVGMKTGDPRFIVPF